MLSRSLDDLVLNKDFKGILMSKKSVSINHLTYADDIVIFFYTKKENPLIGHSNIKRLWDLVCANIKN